MQIWSTPKTEIFHLPYCTLKHLKYILSSLFHIETRMSQRQAGNKKYLLASFVGKSNCRESTKTMLFVNVD